MLLFEPGGHRLSRNFRIIFFWGGVERSSIAIPWNHWSGWNVMKCCGYGILYHRLKPVAILKNKDRVAIHRLPHFFIHKDIWSFFGGLILDELCALCGKNKTPVIRTKPLLIWTRPMVFGRWIWKPQRYTEDTEMKKKVKRKMDAWDQRTKQRKKVFFFERSATCLYNG